MNIQKLAIQGNNGEFATVYIAVVDGVAYNITRELRRAAGLEPDGPSVTIEASVDATEKRRIDALFPNSPDSVPQVKGAVDLSAAEWRPATTHN